VAHQQEHVFTSKYLCNILREYCCYVPPFLLGILGAAFFPSLSFVIFHRQICMLLSESYSIIPYSMNYDCFVCYCKHGMLSMRKVFLLPFIITKKDSEKRGFHFSKESVSWRHRLFLSLHCMWLAVFLQSRQFLLLVVRRDIGGKVRQIIFGVENLPRIKKVLK